MKFTVTPEQLETIRELAKHPGHHDTQCPVKIDGGQEVLLPLAIVLEVIEQEQANG